MRYSELDRELSRVELVLALLRIFAGVLWLSNLVWKLPPDFGRDEPRGLLFSFEQAAGYGLPPFDAIAENLFIPHFTIFGWVVFLIELAAGLLLLTGFHAQIGALIGTAQASAITVLVSGAPNEWRWGYLMLIAIHLVLLATPCAERLALRPR